MRVTYSEEEDFPGQFALNEANMLRSLKSKRGQKALRELEAALLALPDKRLIADEVENDKGEVCAIGALAKWKQYKGTLKIPDVNEWEEYELEAVMMDLAGALGVPRLVAWAIVQHNDDGWYDVSQLTPEARYESMLFWVRRRLLPPASEDIVGVGV